MASDNRGAQPRAITDLTLGPTYRAGLLLELQKFGSSERDGQLRLWQEDEDEPAVIVSGLDLTVTEDKALSALQILLDKTGYQGNLPAKPLRSDNAYQLKGKLPRLEITYSEYLEAYGLERAKDGRYRGKQRDEALQALQNLATEPRAILYERTRHTRQGRRVSDMIRIKSPVIRIEEITTWEGLEPEEAEQVRAGEELSERQRAKGLRIDFSPLLVDQVEDFYLLKPTALHRQIQDHLGKRRISRSISLFIEWLLTKNTATVRIGKKKLAERLRLQAYIQQRQWYRIDPLLQEAIQTAAELGYLIRWEIDGREVYTFWPNPARCSRVQAQAEEAGEEEDE